MKIHSYYQLVFFVFIVLILHIETTNGMKVAIIGAGAAGLITGRYCIEQGLHCDIFEQTGRIGGTWVYTNETDVDENGLPIHSSMYEGLKTNLPKELMSFMGLKYPDELKKSYVGQREVLNYLLNFTNKYDLFDHIQFYKHVSNVKPCEDIWIVEIEDVQTKTKIVDYYNSVIVCNGHFSAPIVPQIKGLETFGGNYIHSHRYRTPSPYVGKKVLVVGASASGTDIANKVLPIADQVWISYKTENMSIPAGVHRKPIITEILNDSIIFKDNTSIEVDEIIFCTGYNYSFPFLDESCKIKTSNQWVRPLYKQVISIDFPTMGFIGLPFGVTPFPLFDVQSRFFIASLIKQFDLPSREDMFSELIEKVVQIIEQGLPLKFIHKFHDQQYKYFDELTNLAGITPLPPVLNKMYLKILSKRDYTKRYEIIDDENFLELPLENE